jgi:hypothetical protein
LRGVFFAWISFSAIESHERHAFARFIKRLQAGGEVKKQAHYTNQLRAILN